MEEDRMMTDIEPRKEPEEPQGNGHVSRCPKHQRCSYPSHQPFAQFLSDAVLFLPVSMVWGLVVMWGVNAVLAGWMDLAPAIGYWDAVAGVAAFYAVRSTVIGYYWK